MKLADRNLAPMNEFAREQHNGVVATHGLTKRYGRITALDECSLSVGSGEILGLLGPNGSGKTTLLRLLMGFLRPTVGSAAIAGLHCHRESVAVHRIVSYLPGDVRLMRNMTGLEVLTFLAKLRGQPDSSRGVELAKKLDLDIGKRVSQMSTGMRQKLALAAVLAVEAPIFILDEPTSNLDPSIRTMVSALILEAKSAGRTVIVSSHVLSEVEQTCDRVIILQQGRLVHDQCVQEIRRCHRITAMLNAALPPVPPKLAEHLTIHAQSNGNIVIETPSELAPVLQWLATLPLAEVHIEPLGLQRVYELYHPPKGAA
jgi:ABC-2 type transport system ATP-binding protein